MLCIDEEEPTEDDDEGGDCCATGPIVSASTDADGSGGTEGATERCGGARDGGGAMSGVEASVGTVMAAASGS